MGDFTEHRRLLAIAQAANVPVTLGHEELAILLDALVEQETEFADLERRLAEANDKRGSYLLLGAVLDMQKGLNHLLREQLAAERQWITELERGVDA